MHGLIRRGSTFHTERIDHLYRDPDDADSRLLLHYGDLADSRGPGTSRAGMCGDRAIVVPRRSEYDLTREVVVARLYRDARPDVVIHLAAVGGGAHFGHRDQSDRSIVITPIGGS